MWFPEPWEYMFGDMLAVGGPGGGGAAAPCIHGLWKGDDFMSQGRPLLKFHLSCSGPKRGGGLGHERTAWNNTAAQSTGTALALAGEWPRRCPFSGAFWWLRKTSSGENCFSAWNQTSSRWFGRCPCVGHYHTKRPIKIKKKKKQTVGGGGQ